METHDLLTSQNGRGPRRDDRAVLAGMSGPFGRRYGKLRYLIQADLLARESRTQ
jgi:hypothetical protein